MGERFSKYREKCYIRGNNGGDTGLRGNLAGHNRMDGSPESREILAIITFKCNHVNLYSQTVLSPVMRASCLVLIRV